MRPHHDRLALAYEVLEGLSVGDAVGEALSYRYYDSRRLSGFQDIAAGTVRFTDDTEMAIALCESLSLLKSVDENALAWAFSSRFKRDPDRGYGKMARRILEEIGVGSPWEEVSKHAFGGGSFGNGAAMRVAPLGAYFSEDFSDVVRQSTRSARVTHYHPEGIAGAVAVAVATAAGIRARGMISTQAAELIWDSVLEHTPESRVRRMLEVARSLDEVSPEVAARELGNGAEVSAQDTVPFCVWNATRCLADYEEAVLSAIEVGGDCDTNCAIIGGMVTAYAGRERIPKRWLEVREVLPVKA